MQRERLTAIVRLLAGIGILLLMLAFLRACLSPPPLPAVPPATMTPSALPPPYPGEARPGP